MSLAQSAQQERTSSSLKYCRGRIEGSISSFLSSFSSLGSASSCFTFSSFSVVADVSEVLTEMELLAVGAAESTSSRGTACVCAQQGNIADDNKRSAEVSFLKLISI